MSAAYMTLEFAGQQPQAAFDDAARVATLLGVWVRMNVNGVEALVAPNDNPRVLHDNWLVARERGATFVSANVIPDPRSTTCSTAAP